MIGGDESSCLSCSFCFGMFCRLHFAGSVALASPQAAMPPRKSPYLTPWSERSGDFRRGLRPSVWLKILKTLTRLSIVGSASAGSASAGFASAGSAARSRAVLSVVYALSVLSVLFVLFWLALPAPLCRLHFAGSVALASPQAAIPPRKSPYLTPWSERSGDFRRGLRPSVWLKILNTLTRLSIVGSASAGSASLRRLCRPP